LLLLHQPQQVDKGVTRVLETTVVGGTLDTTDSHPRDQVSIFEGQFHFKAKIGINVRAGLFGVFLREMGCGVAVAELPDVAISNLNQGETVIVFMLIGVVPPEVEKDTVAYTFLPHCGKELPIC